MMDFLDSISALSLISGAAVWCVLRYGAGSFFTVDQNQRAVKIRFGRAERLNTSLDSTWGATADGLVREDEDRYAYPQLRTIGPGGPYFKWPWETVRKISVATQTVSMAFDPEDPTANANGTRLDAVTKDQLNIGLTGQLRYRVSEHNLYAYMFGVKHPLAHVMAYFISILRERIARFEQPREGQDPAVSGISINDLRKNLRDLNDHMERECKGSAARYGVVLDATLITAFEPPQEVEAALAAINTAHNHVSSEVSLAQARADQKIVQSQRAVEIETLKAQTEVEPLRALAEQLRRLKASGAGALSGYLRNVRLSLYAKASQLVKEVEK